MPVINAKLFGSPAVFKGNKQITFPFRKAEALFYYLLVEGQASRETLVNYFWGDTDEKSARKNLRNAIYTLKKTFDTEVLISPQRSIVKLNPEITFETDFFKFKNTSPKEAVKYYNGEFLEGFLVKNAENFEIWMFEEREKLRDEYLNKLYKHIETQLKEKNYNEAEKYCKELIFQDEFDEYGYRMLMKVYQQQDKYNNAINVYNRLVKVLKDELSISPDEKSVATFEEIVKEKNIQENIEKEKDKEFFFGRQEELQLLKEQYNNFLKGESFKSLIITGELGIGKSKLIETFTSFIKDNNVESIVSYCYQAEERFLLKPWNVVFSRLGQLAKNKNIKLPTALKNSIVNVFPSFDIDSIESGADGFKEGYSSKMDDGAGEVSLLKYQVAEKAVVDAFGEIVKHKKILLVFEDIQWMDELSLALLKNIILSNNQNSIMIIATCRNDYTEKLERFFTQLSRYDLIDKLNLSRFTKEEVEDFIAYFYQLDKEDIDTNTTELIYNETEGNPLFLTEFLEVFHEKKELEFTRKLEDVLKSKIFNLSKESRKILNIACIFFDKVSFKNLQVLSQKEELELIDILDELQNKRILREEEPGNSSDQDIEFKFTHQKFREYIYQQLTQSKRKILHHRIARLLEDSLTNDKRDFLLYSKLIYHFTRAGHKLSALKYRIKHLEKYSHLTHEIFPLKTETDLKTGELSSLDNEKTYKLLDELEEFLLEVKEEHEGEKEYLLQEIKFYYIMARFYIQQGKHEKVLKLVEGNIKNAEELGDKELMLYGYKIMIYYSINTGDLQSFKNYMHLAMTLVKSMPNNTEHLGSLKRIEGLMEIMENNFEKGEKHLQQSIDIFEKLNINGDNKYTLNIAAAYNYMGESKRNKREFKKASAFYYRAINLCEQAGIIKRMNVFYTNAGQNYFDMGKLEKAEEYLENAVKFWLEQDYLYGIAKAYAFLAVLKFRNKEFERAAVLLKESEENATELGNSYEIGLVYRAKAEIKKLMEEGLIRDKKFEKILPESLDYYCQKSIEYLMAFKNCYEIELVQNLRKDISSPFTSH